MEWPEKLLTLQHERYIPGSLLSLLREGISGSDSIIFLESTVATLVYR